MQFEFSWTNKFSTATFDCYAYIFCCCAVQAYRFGVFLCMHGKQVLRWTEGEGEKNQLISTEKGVSYQDGSH